MPAAIVQVRASGNWATGQLGNWATTAAKLATSLLTSFRVVVDEVSPFSLECTMIIHVSIVKRKKINLVNNPLCPRVVLAEYNT